MRHLLYPCLLLALCVAALNTHANESSPQAPSAWINDFDDQADLQEYLREKHQLAASQGRALYVYVYADWCSPCLEFRRRAKQGSLAELLEERMIVMLQFEYLSGLLGTESRYNYVPLIIQVNAAGQLGAFTQADFDFEGPKVRVTQSLSRFFAEHDDTR